jgi:hypothetical protein
MPKYQYETTIGVIRWDESAFDLEFVPDPCPPPGDGWELCGSVLSTLRQSRERILWFWRRPVCEQSKKNRKKTK